LVDDSIRRNMLVVHSIMSHDFITAPVGLSEGGTMPIFMMAVVIHLWVMHIVDMPLEDMDILRLKPTGTPPVQQGPVNWFALLVRSCLVDD
jgi:hypothetical protein